MWEVGQRIKTQTRQITKSRSQKGNKKIHSQRAEEEEEYDTVLKALHSTGKKCVATRRRSLQKPTMDKKIYTLYIAIPGNIYNSSKKANLS